MADGKEVYCVVVLLNQHGQELNTLGWNVAETLLRMTASEFSSASEDEQMQAVEAIDTVQSTRPRIEHSGVECCGDAVANDCI